MIEQRDGAQVPLGLPETTPKPAVNREQVSERIRKMGIDLPPAAPSHSRFPRKRREKKPRIRRQRLLRRLRTHPLAAPRIEKE